MAEEKITNIAGIGEETRAKMRSASVLGLPNNPKAYGKTEIDVKKAMVEYVIGSSEGSATSENPNIVSEINRIVEETNNILEEVYSLASQNVTTLQQYTDGEIAKIKTAAIDAHEEIQKQTQEYADTLKANLDAEDRAHRELLTSLQDDRTELHNTYNDFSNNITKQVSSLTATVNEAQTKISTFEEKINRWDQEFTVMSNQHSTRMTEVDNVISKANKAIEKIRDKADVYKPKLPLTFSWNDVKLGDDISGWTFYTIDSNIDYDVPQYGSPAEGFDYPDNATEVWLKTNLGTVIGSVREYDAPTWVVADKALFSEGYYYDVSYTFPEGSIVTELKSGVVWDDDYLAVDALKEVDVDCEYNFNTKANKYTAFGGELDMNGEDLSGKTLKFDTTVNVQQYYTMPTTLISSSGGYTIFAFYGGRFGIIKGTDIYENTNATWFFDYDGVVWHMSEYTLPDDFGTITGMGTDTFPFMSLKDTVVDCEYNYKAIQKIKESLSDTESGSSSMYAYKDVTGYFSFMQYIDVGSFRSSGAILETNTMYRVVFTVYGDRKIIDFVTDAAGKGYTTVMSVPSDGTPDGWHIIRCVAYNDEYGSYSDINFGVYAGGGSENVTEYQTIDIIKIYQLEQN